jgi:DTW domain-containing protein
LPDHNAILRLRQQELSQSSRVFKARGNKLLRCDRCLLAQDLCICAQRPIVTTDLAMCFIMYRGECYKPSNTGRLVADVIPDNYAFIWDRTQPDPELLALLNNPRYQAIVVFPQQYAEPQRWLASDYFSQPANPKIPLFILLDGTWREAKKIFRSSYLAHLPVLGIQPTLASSYQLREAAHPHQLCTAEVCIEVLNTANEQTTADAVREYFKLFRQAYLVHKPHLAYKDDVS